MKKTVFVGVSGGVDSSVAALLLKQQGYDVHGVFIKTWSPDWLPCTWVDEKRDAMRVCASLNIPFHFLDAEAAYKHEVAEYMISEYRNGRTPNPDVMCNRVIKFGVMWEYAQKHGADYIATGHYAHNDGTCLYKAADTSKDQSYFLWMIRQEELSHILFPLGTMQKSEVRKIAQKNKLFTATKKDSQGICFLGDVDMKEFLGHYIEEKEGNVENENGKVIGTHQGILFYTLGERHGFTITESDPDRKPYYVVAKDEARNVLIVSHSKTHLNPKNIQRVVLRNENWHQHIDNKMYSAHIRYHGQDIEAQIIDAQTIALQTQEPLSLGQSVVLYDEEKMIGGGIINQLK